MTVLDPEEAVTEAVALQRAGRLDEAIQVLERVLDGALERALSSPPSDPSRAVALAQLGALLIEQARWDEAARVLARACAADPSLISARYNLATLQLRRGEAAALDGFDAVIRATPGFAMAHCNRGVALLALGRTEAAACAFIAAAERDPALKQAEHGVATALVRLGRLEEALKAFVRARRIAPADASLANEQGLACLAAGRLEAADQAFDEALTLDPRLYAALLGKAAANERRGRLEQAEADFRRAIDLDPACTDAYNGLANVLERQARPEAAAQAARSALGLRPDDARAHVNLGVALLRLGRDVEAEAAFRSAIAREASANAHHGLAFALLRQARVEEGFREYEHRLETPEGGSWTSKLRTPQWRGEPKPDATVLLVHEQGFGDAIQCARYAALVRARVGRVVLQAPRSLMSLFRSLDGVDAVVACDEPPPAHDLWAAIFSLPGLFGVSALDSTPYLRVASPRVADWARRLPPDGVRIGVAWQGDPNARVEQGRSMPLSALAPLAAVAGVRLVSLQKGFGTAQLDDKALGFPILDLGRSYEAGVFEDTAAIMMTLDLVVCCDTSVGHLAGALGRPVWLALGRTPDWRWSGQEDETAWYPSMRLFRRGPAEDWSETIRRMAAALANPQ